MTPEQLEALRQELAAIQARISLLEAQGAAGGYGGVTAETGPTALPVVSGELAGLRARAAEIQRILATTVPASGPSAPTSSGAPPSSLTHMTEPGGGTPKSATSGATSGKTAGAGTAVSVTATPTPTEAGKAVVDASASHVTVVKDPWALASPMAPPTAAKIVAPANTNVVTVKDPAALFTAGVRGAGVVSTAAQASSETVSGNPSVADLPPTTIVGPPPASTTAPDAKNAGTVAGSITKGTNVWASPFAAPIAPPVVPVQPQTPVTPSDPKDPAVGEPRVSTDPKIRSAGSGATGDAAGAKPTPIAAAPPTVTDPSRSDKFSSPWKDAVASSVKLPPAEAPTVVGTKVLGPELGESGALRPPTVDAPALALGNELTNPFPPGWPAPLSAEPLVSAPIGKVESGALPGSFSSPWPPLPLVVPTATGGVFVGPAKEEPKASPEDVDGRLAQLGAGQPMLLLPVRLETLFAIENGRRVLKVRIYPDEIVADAHEPALTEEEWRAGRAFAGVVQRVTGRVATSAKSEPVPVGKGTARGSRGATAKDTRAPLSAKAREEVRAAWRELTRIYKPARASWIAHVTLGGLNVGRKTSDWTRAVQATLLPDSWLVVGERAQGVVGDYIYNNRSAPLVGRSGPVRLPLALTMRPPRGESGATGRTVGENPWVERPEQLFDEGSAWTVDYDRALACGMAVTLPLPEEDDWNVGFDRLLVLGVCNLTAEDGQRALTGLLDAQRYTRGLALVPQGTPTNNTQGRSAGYPRGDEENDGHFAVEWDPDRATRRAPPGPATGGRPARDGRCLTDALGLEPAVLAGLDGVLGGEQQAAEAMNQALWPATISYFVEQILSPLLSARDVEDLKKHFIHYVRGRGPLPAIRVGAVPYGVLPVSSLTRWKTADDKVLLTIRNLVVQARAMLRQAAPGVDPYGGLPHAGRRPEAPGVDFADMMALDASAREVRVRAVMGPDALDQLFRLFRFSDEQIARSLAGLRGPRQRTLPGLPDRAASLIYDESANRFAGAFVGPGVVDDSVPSVNRFHTLLDASLDQLRAGSVVTAGASLLERLLAHALGLELARCTALGTTTGSDGGPLLLLRDAEIPGVTGTRLWDRLPNDLTLSARRALEDPSSADPKVAALADYAKALGALGELPGNELERLFAETLDTCSHRVDAWATSLFTRRLQDLRATKPRGCLVGAFGWVERLSRREGFQHVRTPIGGPVRSEGFVHAPSLDHAATAALLLNAHLSHRGEDAEMFKVRLTSARVRQTLEILDAVRSGQALNDVLGTLLERRLHDVGADACIAPLRARFPPFAIQATAVPARAATGEPSARTVTDGLAAVKAWQQDPRVASSLGVDARMATLLTEALGDLAATLDGVADTFVAESAFQAVRGNFASANAALKAMGQGARPPEPEVVRTPRSGASLTHRVLLMVPEGAKAPAWEAEKTARALLMPALDAWMGNVLGDPNQVRFRVSWQSGGVTVEETWSLADLQVRPVDVVAMSRERPVGFGREEAVDLGRTELEGRILAHILATSWSEVSEVRVQFRGKPLRRPLVPDVMEVARAVQGLLGAARGVQARDVTTPETAVDETSARDLASRTLQALSTLGSIYADLAVPDAARVLAALHRAADFGIPDALPDLQGTTEAQRAVRVRAEIVRRVARAARESGTESQGSTRGGNDWETLRIEAIGRCTSDPRHVVEALFGQRWPVADGVAGGQWPPPLGGSPERDPRLPSAVELPVRTEEVQDWLGKVRRVRPTLAKWRFLSLLTRALRPGEEGSRLTRQAAVGQIEPPLPLGTAAENSTRGYWRWSALQGVWNAGTGRWSLPPAGTVSMLALQPLGAPAAGEAWTGLLLDEWTEFLPNDKELTGIAFHYDDPGAEAPQSLLLAVPPDPNTPWDEKALLDTLRETLELAKIRSIDLSNLDHYAQVLPAIFLAENDAGDTVSRSFAGTLERDPIVTEAAP